MGRGCHGDRCCLASSLMYSEASCHLQVRVRVQVQVRLMVLCGLLQTRSLARRSTVVSSGGGGGGSSDYDDSDEGID